MFLLLSFLVFKTAAWKILEKEVVIVSHLVITENIVLKARAGVQVDEYLKLHSMWNNKGDPSADWPGSKILADLLISKQNVSKYTVLFQVESSQILLNGDSTAYKLTERERNVLQREIWFFEKNTGHEIQKMISKSSHILFQ